MIAVKKVCQWQHLLQYSLDEQLIHGMWSATWRIRWQKNWENRKNSVMTLRWRGCFTILEKEAQGIWMIWIPH